MTKSPALAVFVNCPLDTEYQSLFRAIVFTIFRCGFRARCALEVIDGGEVRIDKIIRIIRECSYGVHDISRTEPNAAGLPRFNMPFELGLFLGAKRFGDRSQQAKKTLVMDTEPYRYQTYLSDIGGQDVAAHGGNSTEIIRAVGDFLNEPRVHGNPLPSANAIAESYRNFIGVLADLCEAQDQDPQSLPYSDYEWFVTSYVAAPAT